jgi:hypothetical protein
MHFHGILTAVVNHIGRNPFAKISLDVANPHFKELLQQAAIPITCLRVCKIDYSQAGLPKVGLKHAAVTVFDKIPLLLADIKKL